MNDPLQENITILCEEVGIPAAAPDSSGVYRIAIDGQEIRIFTLSDGRAILLGVIGVAAALAEQREETGHSLLTACLALQAVRFGKLASKEVLTLEPETGELVLWRPLDSQDMFVPAFLVTAEVLLNELEFWKNWLSTR